VVLPVFPGLHQSTVHVICKGPEDKLVLSSNSPPTVVFVIVIDLYPIRRGVESLIACRATDFRAKLLCRIGPSDLIHFINL
jgi:hypothetical protein